MSCVPRQRLRAGVEAGWGEGTGEKPLSQVGGDVVFEVVGGA